MSEKNFDDILEKNSEENQQSPLFSYKNSSGKEKMVHKEEIPQEPKEPKSLFKFIKNVFVESENYSDEDKQKQQEKEEELVKLYSKPQEKSLAEKQLENLENMEFERIAKENAQAKKEDTDNQDDIDNQDNVEYQPKHALEPIEEIQVEEIQEPEKSEENIQENQEIIDEDIEMIEKVAEETIEKAVEKVAEEMVEETEKTVEEQPETPEPQQEPKKPETQKPKHAKKSPPKQEQPNQNNFKQEFETIEDADEIWESIATLKANMFKRLTVLTICFVLSLLVAISNDLKLTIIPLLSRKISPNGFLFINVLVGVISLFMAAPTIIGGIKKLFSKQADSDSLIAISVCISLVAEIVNLFDVASVPKASYNIYISVAIFGLLINTIGKYFTISTTEKNFEYCSSDFDKFAVRTADKKLADKLCTGKKNTVYLSCTKFAGNFMKNSYSSDLADLYSKKVAPIILIASAVSAVLTALLCKNASNFSERLMAGLAAASGCASLMQCAGWLLAVNIPLWKAAQNANRNGAVMLGYNSVEEFAQTDFVTVDAQSLFPMETMDILRLKVLGSTPVEQCLLFTASMAEKSGSLFAPAFRNILRGNTNILYPVEKMEFKNSEGLAGWIRNERLLFGTREMMENHSIEGLPSLSEEKEFCGEGFAMYLSVSGVIAAIYAMQAATDLEIYDCIQELYENEIGIVVHTSDGFVNKNFISKSFEIPKEFVKIVPAKAEKDYLEATRYYPQINSSMLCDGSFKSLSALLCRAKDVRFIANLAIFIQKVSVYVGGFIAVILSVLGIMQYLTPTICILYNLVFVLITLLFSKNGKLR